MGAVRIGRVKLKSGGEVRLLPLRRDEGSDRVMTDVRACLESQGEVAGYAFVVWGPDGASTAEQWVGVNSPVFTVMLPDFVRNRLLLMTASRWGSDDALERLGYQTGGP